VDFNLRSNRVFIVETINSDSLHGEDCGVKENSQIKKEAAVANVVEIVLDIFMDQIAAVSAQLPEAGKAGRDFQTLQVTSLIRFYNEGHFRSWSDQRHISLENIDELWQFIQACSAQPISQAGDARIARIRGMESELRSICAHSAKLIEAKQQTPFSYTRLMEEYRAARVDSDRECERQPQREAQQ